MDKVWEIVKKTKYQIRNVNDSAISALIKITSNCRSQCQYCLSWKTSSQIISIFDIIRLVDDISKFKASRIVLSGGEPTMHPDFEKIVNECANRKIPIILITDGQYKKSSPWISDINELIFSIDSHIPEIYRKIRGLNGLSIALENLSKALNTKVKVSVNIVMSNLVIQNINATIDYFIKKGVSNIYIHELETHLGVWANLTPSKNEMLYFNEKTLPAIQSKYPGVVFSQTKIKKLCYGLRGFHCIIPWMHITVRPNGDFYPCCRIGDDNPSQNDKSFCLGNLKNENINDIWKSDERKNIIKLIIKSPPAPCLNCNIGELFNDEERVWKEIESVRM